MKLEDLKSDNDKMQTSSVFEDLKTNKRKAEEAKKRFGDVAVLAGVILVFSLASSLTGMGFANLPDAVGSKADFAFYLTAFSVLTFFASGFMILSLIHDASRKPEEIYENLIKEKKSPSSLAM